MSKEKKTLVEVENASLYIGENKILKNLSFIFQSEIRASISILCNMGLVYLHRWSCNAISLKLVSAPSVRRGFAFDSPTEPAFVSQKE